MDKALEKRRQLFHLTSGLLIVFLLESNTINIYWIVAFLGIAILFSFIEKYTKIFSRALKYFDRDEQIPGKGAITYLIGILLALWLFDKYTALAAISIMVVGDSVAPLIGQHYGRLKQPFSKARYIEGAIAGTIASILTAALFVSWASAIIASIITMVVEALDTKFRIDDNIIMPLIAGVVITAIQAL